MAKLEVASHLYTVTRNGQREVQLCIGDITTLPMEDKVDVIMISAIPYNYVKTKSSVVGALWHNLGVDVQNLAYNHVKEDLRETNYCWISKPLPQDLPFRQLLCYEKSSKRVDGKAKGSTYALSHVFRALMPVFNNTDKTVITPLLATRAQQVPREKMLRNLVMTAIEWMHIGLPLQCFKVVVYARAHNDPSVAKCQEVFEELRNDMATFETRFMLRNPTLDTDIFIVYSKENENLMGKVCKLFKKAKNEAKITSFYQIQTKEDSWQHDVHREMAKSKRVILLLTVDFLSSEICIDAFNVALCVNRQCRRPLLAPFYIEQCNVPQYMAMMQWINCKEHDMGKIERAITFVSEDIGSDAKAKSVAYDVFLSYSHRNLEEARKVLAKLQQANPDLKVFFDYDELRTGVSWQQTLYDAVSRASCVVALVSPEYMTSAVCQEEFNLAMAQHLAVVTTELIPVVIKPVDTYFSATITPVMACGEDFDTQTTVVCQDIIRWLQDGTKSHIFSPVEEYIDYHEVAHKYRWHLFEKHYTTVDNILTIKDNKNQPPSSSPPPENLAIRFSFVASTKSYVTFVERLLQLLQPETKFQFDSVGYGNLDETRDYDSGPPQPQAIFKRGLQKALYIVVVGRLSTHPLYLHLIPIHTNLLDDFWEDPSIRDLAPDEGEGQELMKVREVIKGKGHVPLTDTEVLGLRKVVCDILAITSGQRLPKESQCGDGIILNVIKTNTTVHPPASEEEREAAFSNTETMANASIIPIEPGSDKPVELKTSSRSPPLITIDNNSQCGAEVKPSSHQGASLDANTQNKTEVTKSHTPHKSSKNRDSGTVKKSKSCTLL